MKQHHVVSSSSNHENKTTWKCLFCNSKKNLSSVSTCSICHNKRLPSRIGVHYQGGYYLAKVNTSFKLPTVTIFRVSPSPEIQFKAIIPTLGLDLEECILEVLERSDAIPHRMSRKSSIKILENNLFNTHDDNNSTTSMGLSSLASSSSTASSSSSMALSLAPMPKKLSLFDTVISNANKLVYDSSFGRFVELETLQEKGIDIQTCKTKQFKYAQSMIRSKAELSWAIEDEIKKTNMLQGIINEDEFIKQPTRRYPCSLCETMFPITSLSSLVSESDISDWKKSHGVNHNNNNKEKNVVISISKSHHHEESKLCLFCIQFFNENYEELANELTKMKHTEEHYNVSANRSRSESVSSIGSMNINTNNNNSNHPQINSTDKDVKQIIPNEIERPVSRMLQQFSLTQLKIRADIAKSKFHLQRYAMKSKVTDTTKYGTFLRDKYKDEATLIYVRKQVELNERIAMKVHNKTNNLSKQQATTTTASNTRAISATTASAHTFFITEGNPSVMSTSSIISNKNHSKPQKRNLSAQTTTSSSNRSLSASKSMPNYMKGPRVNYQRNAKSNNNNNNNNNNKPIERAQSTDGAISKRKTQFSQRPRASSASAMSTTTTSTDVMIKQAKGSLNKLSCGGSVSSAKSVRSTRSASKRSISPFPTRKVGSANINKPTSKTNESCNVKSNNNNNNIKSLQPLIEKRSHKLHAYMIRQNRIDKSLKEDGKRRPLLLLVPDVNDIAGVRLIEFSDEKSCAVAVSVKINEISNCNSNNKEIIESCENIEEMNNDTEHQIVNDYSTLEVVENDIIFPNESNSNKENTMQQIYTLHQHEELLLDDNIINNSPDDNIIQENESIDTSAAPTSASSFTTNSNHNSRKLSPHYLDNMELISRGDTSLSRASSSRGSKLRALTGEGLGIGYIQVLTPGIPTKRNNNSRDGQRSSISREKLRSREGNRNVMSRENTQQSNQIELLRSNSGLVVDEDPGITFD